MSDEIKAQAAIAHVLGDPVRLQMMQHLAREECSVTQLCELMGARQQCMSHHLTILKLRGLGAYRRDGKSNIYSITAAGRAALERAGV